MERQRPNFNWLAFSSLWLQILFMNKLDLFQEKILHSGRHLRLYLPQFKGAFALSSRPLGPEVWKQANAGSNCFFIFPQVQTVMWTPPPTSWPPPSSRSTPPPANSSTTTSPQPRTPPTSRWCSRWWWTPSSKRTWRPCRCCRSHTCNELLWEAWKHGQTERQTNKQTTWRAFPGSSR